jgi:hypothetical protein
MKPEDFSVASLKHRFDELPKPLSWLSRATNLWQIRNFLLQGNKNKME